MQRVALLSTCTWFCIIPRLYHTCLFSPLRHLLCELPQALLHLGKGYIACRILLFTCSSPQVEVLIFMADSNHSHCHHIADSNVNPNSDGGGWGGHRWGVGGTVITICHQNQHLHLRGGASAREDSASAREDKILPSTCNSFFDNTPPLIITNHPPFHLQ